MSTRPLNLRKGDSVITLYDQAHIDAYKAKGWQVIPAAPKPAPKPRKAKETSK